MEERREMLLTYIKENIAPIMLDFMEGKDFSDAVIITSKDELTGHYEETEYVAPEWYKELEKRQNKILIIDKIDEIDKEEQLRFVEILKYRKISTFELPKECVIIITAKNINKETINKEIFSLVARI